jgi:conjugative transfer signal peptidase TraF
MRRRALFCLALASPLLVLALALLCGFRVNHTHSFPVGVYWTIPKHPEKGDLVMFAPSVTPVFNLALVRGYIGPGGLQPYEHMLKRIVAVEGDTVSVDETGVTVNGRQLNNGVPLPRDLAGRPMPVCRLQGCRLQPGEVLLMSDYSPISFDGRYFGPVQAAQIQSVVRPVWTW